jgi:hypothetical protein
MTALENPAEPREDEREKFLGRDGVYTYEGCGGTSSPSVMSTIREAPMNGFRSPLVQKIASLDDQTNGHAGTAHRHEGSPHPYPAGNGKPVTRGSGGRDTQRKGAQADGAAAKWTRGEGDAVE